MIDERGKFREKIETAKEQYFPHGKLEVMDERLNFLKVRIVFKEELFLDIYYNSANNRTDYALIEHGKRIFGCDNLGGWHIHPYENPDVHKKCAEPKVDEIFERVKKVIGEL